MFTGLVADLGTIKSADDSGDGKRLRIETRLAPEIKPGDSVAVNGVCLTATEVDDGGFAADVMNQTLAVTSLGPLGAGAGVNLELALAAGERFGGHMVQGHVDGTGTVSSVTADGFARRVVIEAPPQLRRYLAAKGSVTVDGVSLTVADVTEAGFEVSLIPETLERTTLGALEAGALVNLEIDVIARYAERLLAASGEEGST